MGLLADTQNCGLRMRRECRERFLRHWRQGKPLVGDPGMHHGTCVTHVPWCMLRSLTSGGGENVLGIPGTCTTRTFTYLARRPWHETSNFLGIFKSDRLMVQQNKGSSHTFNHIRATYIVINTSIPWFTMHMWSDIISTHIHPYQ